MKVKIKMKCIGKSTSKAVPAQAMKEYRGGEVWPHSFLTSALGGSDLKFYSEKCSL